MIQSLKLKNFKLFIKEDFTFDKINLIKGVNFDDKDGSSNGSGKSSVLEGIIFGLYGEGSGKNLVDLINFNSKTAEVELTSNGLSIIRKIPANLSVFQNGIEVQFNTSTLKQNWLNEKIGSYDFFKKYRLVNRQAVNLLDLGITSLRKELMAFIDTDFSSIRSKLLSEKLERETYNVSKKLYSFYISEKRWNKLTEAKLKFDGGVRTFKDEQHKLFQTKSELSGKIRSIDYIIKNNKEVAEQIKTKKCPTCGTVLGTEKITAIKGKSKDELERLLQEKQTYQTQLDGVEGDLEYCNDNLTIVNNSYQKVASLLMKLTEAKKFSEYKYTKADVELYASAIKVLDEFSGWYVQNWLTNLTTIMNDLLSVVNLSVQFSADKQFLTMTNNSQTMKYELLSGGQKIFLNLIFKIAIMLNNGLTDGLLIIDEGVGEMDLISLHKLIDILRTTNFQVFLIYQNIDEIEDVNVIKIQRQANISTRND
jgi:DNA repair exonuclease SbcCD ATPase subunit